MPLCCFGQAYGFFSENIFFHFPKKYCLHTQIGQTVVLYKNYCLPDFVFWGFCVTVVRIKRGYSLMLFTHTKSNNEPFL